MNQATDKLLLSEDEIKQLNKYANDEPVNDYKKDPFEDAWFGIQIGKRMFDLNLWDCDLFGNTERDKGKLVCTVYESDSDEFGGYTTNYEKYHQLWMRDKDEMLAL